MAQAVHLLDVWKYALDLCGQQCVMTSGTTEMPVFYAGNWDTHHMVCCLLMSKQHSLVEMSKCCRCYFVIDTVLKYTTFL